MAIEQDLGHGPTAVMLLGKALVLWRDAEGGMRCFEDRCPHRCALGMVELLSMYILDRYIFKPDIVVMARGGDGGMLRIWRHCLYWCLQGAWRKTLPPCTHANRPISVWVATPLLCPVRSGILIQVLSLGYFMLLIRVYPAPGFAEV